MRSLGILTFALLPFGVSLALIRQSAGDLPQQPQSKEHVAITVSEKEKKLHGALIEIRDAIKEYKQLCDMGLVGPADRRIEDKCYPPTVESLVEGIRPPDKKYYIVFLKRIPIDPMTGSADWILRSFQDEKWTAVWGGQNVFNVYSKSEGIGSDGTPYRNW